MTGGGVDELLVLLRGRDLSDAAIVEAASLAREGMADEVRDAVRHLRSLPIVRREALSRITDVTTRLLLDRLDGLDERQQRHVERIRRAAVDLGRQLVAYSITRADVDHRLGRLIDRCDDEFADLADVRLVPYEEGRAVAAEALRRGMNQGAVA